MNDAGEILTVVFTDGSEKQVPEAIAWIDTKNISTASIEYYDKDGKFLGDGSIYFRNVQKGYWTKPLQTSEEVDSRMAQARRCIEAYLNGDRDKNNLIYGMKFYEEAFAARSSQ